MTNKNEFTNIRYAKGPTILMSSGVYFDYLYPEETPITIDDYVNGLLSEGRYRGQTINKVTGYGVRYTVLQHAYLAAVEAKQHAKELGLSKDAADDLAFEALMHESGEVVCGDMTSPLKSLLPEYKVIEKRCEKAIGDSFGVKGNYHDIVKEIDNRLWMTERRDMLNWSGEEWSGDHGLRAYKRTIYPIADGMVKSIWLATWRILDGPGRMRRARNKGVVVENGFGYPIFGNELLADGYVNVYSGENGHFPGAVNNVPLDRSGAKYRIRIKLKDNAQ
jgi:5'-deoxynucleotidase YfbR-like HD superfamily hydrolase